MAQFRAQGSTLPTKAAASKEPTVSLIRSGIGSYYFPGIRTSDVLAMMTWVGFRSFPVEEYLVVYCIEDRDVLILRVVHGRRDLEALFGVT
jgi:hypothetical protein